MIPILAIALIRGEPSRLPALVASLDLSGVFWVASSCVVGVGISYCGVWAQSLISATSFLVLVNCNKFLIIFIDAIVLKTVTLTVLQVIAASITILAGCAYAYAQE